MTSRPVEERQRDERRHDPRLTPSEEQGAHLQLFSYATEEDTPRPLSGAQVVNVSRGGLGFHSAQRMTVGTVVQLRVADSSKTTHLIASGQIVRVSQPMAGRHLHGAQFASDSSEQVGAIIVLLFGRRSWWQRLWPWRT